ncbi:hypothetical protein HZZ13_05955 [Bradyrhizobium sp. CNPSo 4010]|uniref:Uncharacterized protein n=1 Tax=Bradyrhizobium agreste TaxID=2751811 RepID=A0ABS0PJF6_9BRAD|nr:hypothetical protein [Bradyrhizobium agreste]MBH5397335.1 hypothetical protein [Bradyrhizobium agreste]
METIRAYLERKHEELRLLNDGLRNPLDLAHPCSVDDVVRFKFQITAALRAEHELQEWKATETAWSHTAAPASGPFEFIYDYQRADLTVRGPSFYQLDDACTSTAIYTASGMAAISAVLLASARIVEKADILVLPGSYGETLELIRSFMPHLRIDALKLPLGDALARGSSPRILLLDSCSVAGAIEAVLRRDGSGLDLLIFDTTCFAGRSGRVRRVMRWAGRCGIAMVLVRSHNKLDSLGAEYGRLGSAVFVHGPEHRLRAGRVEWTRLASETRNAVRLLGGAALPAHFPPFAGSAAYWALTKRRVAAILRNGRSSARYFAAEIPALAAQLRFAHGLYVTLRGRRALDEAAARQAAEDMSCELRRDGFPIRHAGSFGFDFAATEWFHDATTDQYSVRVAVPDLPTELWDDLTAAIGRWWRGHQRANGG